MKGKKIYIVLTIILLLFSFYCFNHKEEKINKIIESESYSYLSNEAKEYIKTVYEETNEVVLTEENKKDNEPYLNPTYIEYLSLSEEEKESVELIPETYTIDYNETTTYEGNDNLPVKYDLRNINGKKYITSIKDQGKTNLCWIFASIESVETLIMKKNNTETIDNFSIRQLDYATSSDYLAAKANWIECSDNCSYTEYDNSLNESRSLNTGGNFYTATVAMANAITLTSETVLPWNEEKNPKLASKILGTDKSLYELDSSIVLPKINEDSVSDDTIDNYVSMIKNYILEYGGPFVGTLSPKSSCSFNNTDGYYVLKTDDCYGDSGSTNMGHAMQIIGWDDEYNYSYCENGTKHTSVSSDGTCSSGTLVKEKGAWILRNSWGESTSDGNTYKYVYLTYNSTRLDIGFTTSVSKMSDRTWDNNYYDNPWIDKKMSNGFAQSSLQLKTFNTNNTKNEKVEKIKIFTLSINGKYNISITSDNREYNNIATLNSEESGIYTIDLSDKNIIVGSSFTVKIEGINSLFYYNTMSVFTSNVDDEEYAIAYSTKAYDSSKPLSNDNPLYTDGGDNIYYTIKTYLKNIPQNAELTYKLVNDSTTSTNFSSKEVTNIPEYNSVSISDNINRSSGGFSYSSEIGNTWTFQILYNDKVLTSFPIKFNTDSNKTSSTVKLYANNGTNEYYEANFLDKTSHIFTIPTSLYSAFYNDGYYIKSWNTKSDGNGTNYELNSEILIYKDTILYAQWSNEKLDVNVRFKVDDNVLLSKTYNSNEKILMVENTENKDGYVFSKWILKKSTNYYEYLYEEEESYYQILSYLENPIFNNTEYDITAKWISDSNYITITFDPNGGIGNMSPINVEKYSDGTTLASNRIKTNLFTKEGYIFDSWNTEIDGSGISYNDKGYINSENNITLYAQWVETIKVIFDSNGGTGSMDNINVIKNEQSMLTSNLYEKEGYEFNGWNTEPDGSGNSYSNKQIVNLTDDLTLYAQWKIKKYNISFNANSGTGTMNNQIFEYNILQNLNENTYSKKGYNFVGWNTKSDGTGISYSDNQNIKTSNDLILYAQWKINEYSIQTNQLNGTITVNNTAKYNEKVYFSINPNYGYKISNIKILNSNNEDITNNVEYNNYSFVMPNYNVIIELECIEIKINKSNITISKGNNNSLIININEQEDVEKYVIYRSTNNKKYTTYKTITTNTFTDTGLTYGTTYYYKVKAYNSYNGYTEYSNVVYKKVVPNKVTNLKTTSIKKNTIKLSFDKVSTTGYEVYRSTNNKSWSKVSTITKNSTVTYTNKYLSTNKTYYYKVRAYKTVKGKKIYGSYSDVLKVRTAPDKGKISVSLKDYNALNIKVTTVKGATKYKLYRSTDNKNFSLLKEVSSGTYVDNTVELGKTYYYKVKACNSSNTCGNFSSVSKLKVTPKVPSMTLKTTSKKVTISTKSITADGYEVYKSTSKKGKYTKVGENTFETLSIINSTKKNKTYYYKIRSYIVKDGKKVYSSYSSIKSIKSK